MKFFSKLIIIHGYNLSFKENNQFNKIFYKIANDLEYFISGIWNTYAVIIYSIRDLKFGQTYNYYIVENRWIP